MSACPSRDSWVALLTSPLDEPLPVHLESHLGDCGNCQQLVLELTGASEEEWDYWRHLCVLPKRKPRNR